MDSLESLAVALAGTLSPTGDRLVTAESCTGGWVAQVVTSVAGSSAWFERGFVTYSNEAKQELLGVTAEMLARHGAVSAVVVEAMARGALAASRATLAVAVSGVAGPAGGTPAKPVGTVWLAWATRGGETRSRHHLLGGDRTTVRRQATELALQGLIEFSRGRAGA